MDIPTELQRNSHFMRYFRTWQKNELSIVFIPLAQICREQGFLEIAREICEKGLARHPTSVSGRLMLARIFMDRDEDEKANEIIEKVLHEYPAQQEAQALLEKVSRCRGDGDRTPKEQLREDRPYEQPTTSLWENPTMAKIYADQGETRIALKILDKILARNPQNACAAELKRVLSS
jgi:tetratricopeptide (TPR) repeat protein